MHIFIKNLELNMIIGIFDYERHNPQTVHFDIDITIDDNSAATDNIDDTLDYNRLILDLSSFEHHEYFLLETLIHDVAAFILERPHVHSVKVSADKGKLYDNVDKVVVSGEWSRE